MNVQDEVTNALRDVIIERHRQINIERFSTAHDDEHTDCSLAIAAAYYATFFTETQVLTYEKADAWPWSEGALKIDTHRRNCVKAAALLLAEIERLDRIEVQP